MPDQASTAPRSVVVEDVSKTFRLPYERVHTFKERALHPFRRRRYHELRALDGVSFDVASGEYFGVVGRNGSGKSTLLKCLAGIYRTDGGTIRLRGRMATFIELGVGFNPDLTARENVLINAIMLGLTPAEARRRYDAVIDFAELGEFQELKLKNYSSGMYVRLAFSVMVQAEADTLLIDEVLAVGDASFQQKCHEVLAEQRKQGHTILLVTHDMGAVERTCDRALLFERGRLVEVGDPERIARLYDRINFERAAEAQDERDNRFGDGAAEVIEATLEDARGNPVNTIDRGQEVVLRALVEFHRGVTDPVLGFQMGTEHHPRVFATSTRAGEGATGEFRPGDHALLEVSFTNLLGPGRYSISPFVLYPGSERRTMDLVDSMVKVTVVGSRLEAGVVELPHEVRVERPGRERALASRGEGQAS